MSYVENALTISRARPRTIKGQRGSQADFVQALRVLGARFLTWHATLMAILEVATTFQECSSVVLARLGNGADFFWPAQPPIDHHAASVPRPFQAWGCYCPTVICCVSDMFFSRIREFGVVFARMCFLLCSSRLLLKEVPHALNAKPYRQGGLCR